MCYRKDLPGYTWDHYGQSVPMSTYLVAFVVSDFDHISEGNFSVWARHEAIKQAEYSLSIGPKILHYYEKYFGIPFPLPKIDMVALPDFAAGAMENWGLITYRWVNINLFMSKKEKDSAYYPSLFFVIVHTQLALVKFSLCAQWQHMVAEGISPSFSTEVLDGAEWSWLASWGALDALEKG